MPLAYTADAKDIVADPTMVPPTERLNTAIAWRRCWPSRS